MVRREWVDSTERHGDRAWRASSVKLLRKTIVGLWDEGRGRGYYIEDAVTDRTDVALIGRHQSSMYASFVERIKLGHISVAKKRGLRP